MKTSTINSFSGSRMSGLLKEVFNRIYNGGLNETHLDLLLINGKNPYDPVVYSWWEWKLFYKEVFKVGICEKDYSFPTPFFKNEVIIVLTSKKSEAMNIEALKNRWQEMFGMEPVTIENPESRRLDLALDVPACRMENTIKQFWMMKFPEELSTRFVQGDLLPGKSNLYITVEEAMLWVMFMAWKNGHPRLVEKSPLDGYTIACTGTKYNKQPESMVNSGHVAFPLFTVRYSLGNKIYIYPSGNGAWYGRTQMISFIDQKEE